MQDVRVISFVVLPLIAAGLHVLISRQWARVRVIEIFLSYILGVSIGANGIFSFIGHFFLSDMVAESIGWPAGNPFQLEVAFTNLALGILGVLSVWYRGGFRVATAIFATTFLFGANLVHIMDLLESGNLSPGNTGLFVPGNFLRPALLIGLLIAQTRSKRSTTPDLAQEMTQLDGQAFQTEWRPILRTGLLVGICFAIAGLIAGFASGDWVLWLGTSIPLGVILGAGLQFARLKIVT